MAVLLALMGCGEDTEPLCVPGETRSCVCVGARAGAQLCNADGDAWACCHCDGSALGDDDDTTAGDDDDTTASDDDDATPGDDDDITPSDDDDDDDGDDDDTWPSAPGGMMLDVQFEATGGEGPGTATVELIWTMLDDTQNQNHLCAYTYEYEAEYPAIAPGQGDDFYTFIDLVITFTAGVETDGNCPAEYDDYAGGNDPVAAVEWFVSPVAVITCDVIAAVPNLQGTQYIDDLYGAGMTDGSMASWCLEFGPAAGGAWGLGPMEGLWVKPSDSSAGAGSFGIEYLPAPNGDVGGLGYADSWSAMGTVFAASSNGYEPDAGIEGDYVTVPIWVFAYSA